ncbi:hypothetical protein BO71DRAFT_478405 [Aspergillus ellipticus CBS 707.79]|uniref:WAP domain-containing protein n=1 Tax=Aspergillus ellipticus CBS 707.79 TaxID=1448320 RepID=A0A319D8F2_9EURO|nr:hypothetical protein BO71DRAFT_478405 [Aspergillus ellipticus CBS 707.79]
MKLKMKVFILLLFAIGLLSVAALPQDGVGASDASDDWDPSCYKDEECGAGSCYNGICLQYSLRDAPSTELTHRDVDKPTVSDDISSVNDQFTVDSSNNVNQFCRNSGQCRESAAISDEISSLDEVSSVDNISSADYTSSADDVSSADDQSTGLTIERRPKDPKCHRHRDCYPGCCYHGVCLASCVRDDAPSEVEKRSVIPEDIMNSDKLVMQESVGHNGNDTESSIPREISDAIPEDTPSSEDIVVPEDQSTDMSIEAKGRESAIPEDITSLDDQPTDPAKGHGMRCRRRNDCNHGYNCCKGVCHRGDTCPPHDTKSELERSTFPSPFRSIQLKLTTTLHSRIC